MTRPAMVGLLLIGSACAADLKQIYDSHDWFRLRDAVRSGQASPFYKGAVAAAFHDRDAAGRYLGAAIRTSAKEEALEAHLLLVSVYMREGRAGRALRHLKAARRIAPERQDVRSALGLFELLAAWPDQQLVQPAQGSPALDIHDDNIFIPITVNGKPLESIFDTGANWCMISEGEAKRLGMPIRETQAELTDSTGRSTALRVANAREFKFGAMKLRNVTFIVARDDQQPFRDLQPHQRSVVGLPVLLAAGGLTWGESGKLELGTEAPAGEPNLAFEGATPLTAIEYAGRRLPAVLDTGASITHLWPKFAAEFTETLARGAKGTTSFSGVGHRVEVESVTIPVLDLRLGGMQVPIHDAKVLLKQEGDGAKYFYANLGCDLLAGAKRGTLDFRRMRLVLE